MINPNQDMPFLHIGDEQKYAEDRDKRMGLASLGILKTPQTHLPAAATTHNPHQANKDSRVNQATRDDDKFNIPLICARSGLFLGKFIPGNGLAVATPYVQAWKSSIFLHPIFSLPLGSLITRAEACWQLEKNGVRSFPMAHKQLLFLAMLHASDCIKQDVAGLPSPRIVEAHFNRLIELLGWKQDTASERVSFPKLHVWRGAAREDENNVFGNVGIWLDVVEVCKDEYENISRTRMKEARRKAHDMAMKNIKKAMYEDINLKRLWGWFTAQVPQVILENNADLEQLWYCDEQRIHVWTIEDIEAIETLLLKYCEIGNSVSHEFSKHIKKLAEWLNTYNDTFEIVVDTSAERYASHKGTPEPTQGQFKSKAEYFIARARWQLANKSVSNIPTSILKNKVQKGSDL